MITLLETLAAAWPHSVSLAELENRLAGESFSLESGGASILNQVAAAGFLSFHSWKAPLAEGIGERPRMSGSARQEAARQSHVTSLLHEKVDLQDPFLRALLQLADGSRDRQALALAMRQTEPEMDQTELTTRIESQLDFFYRAALLEA